jgi:two-component system sensor histidine kinase PhoQ
MELLGNLIDNACKSAQSQVKVSAEFFDRSLHICVEDDGDGIKPEQADEILSRGKRLDTYQDGQGIGLSVVMDLLDSYNGQLKIDQSTLGGAKFHLVLP